MLKTIIFNVPWLDALVHLPIPAAIGCDTIHNVIYHAKTVQKSRRSASVGKIDTATP